MCPRRSSMSNILALGHFRRLEKCVGDDSEKVPRSTNRFNHMAEDVSSTLEEEEEEEEEAAVALWRWCSADMAEDGLASSLEEEEEVVAVALWCGSCSPPSFRTKEAVFSWAMFT